MLEREVQDQDYQISAKSSETHSLQVDINPLLLQLPVTISLSD